MSGLLWGGGSLSATRVFVYQKKKIFFIFYFLVLVFSLLVFSLLVFSLLVLSLLVFSLSV